MGSDPLNIAFVFPTAEIFAAFNKLGEDVKDLRPAFREAAKDFSRDMVQQFKQEGRGPSKWTGLSPITQEIRAQEGDPPSHPIMKRTGKLQRSFTTQGAAGHIREINKLSLVIGSNLKVSWRGKSWVLAWIHTEGFQQQTTGRQEAFFRYRWGINLSEGGTLTMPERRILFVSPAGLKRMLSRIHIYILDRFGDRFKGFVDVYQRSIT